MDEAVKVAYEFYSQHPDETLIVVTADHETGGFVLGTGAYKLNLQVLKNQKVSESGFTRILNELRKSTTTMFPGKSTTSSERKFRFLGQSKT